MFNQVWYQIVLTRTSSNGQIVYLNGSQIGTGNVSNTFTDGDTDFGAIGADNPGYSGYLNGKVGSVRIYNRALTPEEIQQNFNTTKSRFGL